MSKPNAYLISMVLDKATTVEVETPLGTIRGHVHKSPQGENVNEYLGLPYALPPVGTRRFKDPQPLNALPAGTLR